MTMDLIDLREFFISIKLKCNRHGSLICSSYELSDGQKRTEVGQIIDDALSVTGSFSFVGPDGVSYFVSYAGDKDGFTAFGNHLPQVAIAEGPNSDILPIGDLPPKAINSLLGG